MFINNWIECTHHCQTTTLRLMRNKLTNNTSSQTNRVSQSITPSLLLTKSTQSQRIASMREYVLPWETSLRAFVSSLAMCCCLATRTTLTIMWETGIYGDHSSCVWFSPSSSIVRTSLFRLHKLYGTTICCFHRRSNSHVQHQNSRRQDFLFPVSFDPWLLHLPHLHSFNHITNPQVFPDQQLHRKTRVHCRCHHLVHFR